MSKLVVSSLKVAILALGSLVFSSTSYAADGSNGCGVGWYIAKENSLISTTTRSVTNQILPNTFSMTSGTSNCAKHSIVLNEKKGLHFVESNVDALEINIAAGEGQFLEGFAGALGCNPAVLPLFASTLQANYAELFQNQSSLGALEAQDSQSSQDLYLRIKGVLLSKGQISQQCLSFSG